MEARDETSFETSVLHSTLSHNCMPNSHGAVNTEIQLSSTFLQSRPGTPVSNFEYSRSGNPTRNALEYSLASIECAKYAVSFSSGLAALDSIVSVLKPKSRMICVADLYGGSRRYLTNIASKTGIEIDYEMGCMLSVEYGEYEMVLLETPTNPTLRVYPIEDIVRKAKYDNPNIIVVVDNTFMSPMNQNPLLLGVDMVMHSLTKYINGHSDVVGGAVMCNDDDIEKQLRYHQYSLGAVPSPFDCYLIQRGIKTLPLRMEKHNTNALMIAEELSKIEQFTQVIYPGLPTHPDHLIAKNQCRGFGGIITVEYSGCVDTFVSKLQLFSLAESLGAVESLVNVPSKMTHASVPEEVRKELGISNQMIRLSIGCENADDLLKDILYAIDE